MFLVEDLCSGKTQEVHGRRLKFFRNKDFEVDEEVLNHIAYQAGELLVIDSFLDIRRNKGTVELLIKWRGFTEDETDWVTHESLREDVPEMLQEYLNEVSRSGARRQRAIIESL